MTRYPALLLFLASFGGTSDMAGATLAAPGQDAASGQRLTLSWENGFLTIRGAFPGKRLRVQYLEAYCRPGSTDRDWDKTVIPHQSVLESTGSNRHTIRLTDTLADGAIVHHTITAGTDEVDFCLVATNPTPQVSAAHWAQPCIRVDRFTGCGTSDACALVPAYARQCFLFLDGHLAHLPTTPWADQARYVPGQVYCPAGVDRNDVNPRPLSPLVPSNGLTGCFSADGRHLMAVAWEPYQEIFQGVVTCIHSDPRIGGLQPGETKKIHGKIYLIEADIDALLRRYRQDFPAQAAREK